MLTLMPARLTAWAARTASAISVPATKRPETRRPSKERSAKLRKDGFSERRTKNVLNIPHLYNYGSRPADRYRPITKDDKHTTLYHKRGSTLRQGPRKLGRE